MSTQLRVLVVGASIAGPTAAYWLAKAGAKVTVIERFPQFRTGGQNIDIRTAGVVVMRRMAGMEAAVRAKTIDMEGISFVSDDGTSYGTLRATGNPDQQSLVSEYEIFRGDLARVLYDMTESNENISYVFGEQVAAIQQNEKIDGPVTVEFTNSLPTCEFDLVVACDGATSRTRAIGFGCGVRDHIKPTGCWAAYYSIKQDLLEGGKIAKAYNAPGGRFIGIGIDPAGGNRIAMINMSPLDGRDVTLPFREASKQGETSLKQFVAQQYKGAGWKNEEMIEGMMEADDFYGSEVVHVKTPDLYKGRFVLVGDAGYAAGFTGGGTTLAMAGAYLLAGEICKHKGDLAAGLEGYEKQVRPLITEFQKTPPFIASFMAPQTTWGIWVRNRLFAFIAWSKVLEYVQKYWAGAFAGTDKFPLPEYDWVA